jgi:hypothetical protein
LEENANPAEERNTPAEKPAATTKDKYQLFSSLTTPQKYIYSFIKEMYKDFSHKNHILIKNMNIIHPQSGANCEFATLSNQYMSDKVSHHGYNRFYPRFIDHYKNVYGGAMLEIGVQDGRSLHIWTNYFPNAFVYGIDIDHEVYGDRYAVFKCDQSIPAEVEKVWRKIDKPIFFILDDGSHHPAHQISTFNYLFTHLLVFGGTYIIEDIETSYWLKGAVYGYETRFGYRHPKSAIEVFKLVVEDINREFTKGEDRAKQSDLMSEFLTEETRKLISSITFGMNCIIITKKTVEEMEIYSNRKYRFDEHL